MGNQLIKTTTENQLANITANLSKELYQINHLVAFPVSDLMLESWAKSIYELIPNVTPEIIKKVINDMKLNKTPYDAHRGIRDLISAINISLGDRQPITFPR